jgi:hypothetical protein
VTGGGSSYLHLGWPNDRGHEPLPPRRFPVHEQDLLLVTDAGLVTLIIGLAISLILIVIGSFFKKKIPL